MRKTKLVDMTVGDATKMALVIFLMKPFLQGVSNAVGEIMLDTKMMHRMREKNETARKERHQMQAGASKKGDYL